MSEIEQFATLVVEYKLKKKETRLAKRRAKLEEQYLNAKTFLENRHYTVCPRAHIRIYAPRCLFPHCREQVCTKCYPRCDNCHFIYCVAHRGIEDEELASSLRCQCRTAKKSRRLSKEQTQESQTRKKTKFSN